MNKNTKNGISKYMQTYKILKLYGQTIKLSPDEVLDLKNKKIKIDNKFLEAFIKLHHVDVPKNAEADDIKAALYEAIMNFDKEMDSVFDAIKSSGLL